ncbi:MAG: pilus assembly protein [bacterium]|nr:pilus assembly protein [bacterium]MDO9464302.1 pilus assembly protein [bacterium]
MKLIRSNSGQAAVEAAIVLPIFILIMMIVVHFGKVMVAQSKVYIAAREGALKETRDGGGAGAVFFGHGNVNTSFDLLREAGLPDMSFIPGTNYLASFLSYVMAKGSAKMDVTYTVPAGPYLSAIFGGGTTVKGSCRFLGFCFSKDEIIKWIKQQLGEIASLL